MLIIIPFPWNVLCKLLCWRRCDIVINKVKITTPSRYTASFSGSLSFASLGVVQNLRADSLGEHASIRGGSVRRARDRRHALLPRVADFARARRSDSLAPGIIERLCV